MSENRGVRPLETTAERRALRRGELLSAAMAVIRRDGPGATMEEMALAGGISKPILYRHFTDRGGLVSAIAETALAELREIVIERVERASGEGTMESNRAVVDGWFSWIAVDPELFRFLVDHASSGDGTTAAFIAGTSEIVENGLRQSLINVGRDPEPTAVWARAIVGALVVTASWWTSEAQHVPQHQVVDDFTELGWFGLLGRRTS